MTSSDLERVPLPVTAAPNAWTPQQGALMAFVGLAIPVGNAFVLKPGAAGVAEAFLAICRRSGLDPFARQIYVIETKSGPAIVTGVDGFRVVAQRSKGYAGQIGPQWFTGRTVRKPLLIDGRPVFDPNGAIVMTEQEEWVDAWTPDALGLPKETVEVKGKDVEIPARPVAARIGIVRDGFREPLWQVVTWAEFGVEPRFPGDNWLVRPAHMLGIRAETHGLRRTFPNDLSNLYTPEDFDDDELAVDDAVGVEIKRIEGITDLAELTRVYHELNAVGMPDSVRATIMARAGVLKSEASDGNGTDSTAAQAEAAQNPDDGQTGAEAPRGRKSAPTAPEPKVPEEEEFTLAVPEGEAGALDDWEAEEIRRHEAEVAATEEQDR